MKKVLVAEIGNETTVVNAFGNLDSENPRLLGQGGSPTNEDIGIGVKSAVIDLESNIGPIGLDNIPFYATSSITKNGAIEDNNTAFITRGKITSTSEAIAMAARLIFEEVGNVIVLDVSSTSTNIYSITSESSALRTIEEDLGPISLVKQIGENIIREHHGQDWEELLKSNPKTPEEISLSAELTAAAISIALQRHSEQCDLTQIRWIVGTGIHLTQRPNGCDIMKESIIETNSALFSKEGIAMLLDKDCIMASLGVLTRDFRAGAWQLLRESLGVEN